MLYEVSVTAGHVDAAYMVCGLAARAKCGNMVDVVDKAVQRSTKRQRLSYHVRKCMVRMAKVADDADPQAAQTRRWKDPYRTSFLDVKHTSRAGLAISPLKVAQINTSRISVLRTLWMPSLLTTLGEGEEMPRRRWQQPRQQKQQEQSSQQEQEQQRRRRAKQRRLVLQ